MKGHMKMKRFLSVIFILAFSAALLVSCGTTPDVTASEAANVTLEDVNWTIPITIESTGETVNYTIDMAKAHELTKIYASIRQFENAAAQGAGQVTTMILEGVKFQDVLDEIGASDAESITVYHNNTDTVYDFDSDIIHADETVLGWIQNKTEIVDNSAPSYVAFGANAAAADDFVHSVKSITIH